MNGKFYNYIVLAIVSLFLLSLISCQPESSAKSAVDSNKLDKPEKTAKSAPSEKTEKPASLATIKFDSMTHDFGEVAPDSYNDCVFKFTNTGTGTLEITGTKGTCKCTVPNLSKKDYAPGETGELKVRFHAPKFQGPTSQHIFVFTNDPNSSKAELEIKARVKSQVVVEPETMSLSLIAPNADANTITVKSVDGEKFAIKKIESAGEVFSINFDPNNIADTHVLLPVVDVNNLRRYLSGYLMIETTHPTCKSARMQYNCMREFEALPSALIVRDAVAGQPEKRTISLTSNYNEDITIESIVSDKGLIKVVGQNKTENHFEFEVEITPPARDGKLRVFSDTLHINIKGKESLDILCRGFYSAGSR